MSKKISQLEEKAQLTGDEYIVLQEGTTNKKAKVANLPKQDLSGLATKEEVQEVKDDVNLLLGAGFGLWYGVEWDVTESDSAVTRIGTMDLHRSLPIQSGMYR